MPKSLSTGHVPSERIVAAIDEALGTEWPWSFPYGPFDEPSPLMPLTRFWKGDDIKLMLSPARNGGWIEFDFADKMLCVLSLEDLWRGELSDLYEAVDLQTEQQRVRRAPPGSIRCGRRGCGTLFKPGMPWARYCSKNCKMAEQRHRRSEREQRPQRYGHRYDTCPNGHDRSPENVYERPNGSIACRACRREAAQAKYASDPAHAERKRQAERERRAARKVAA